MRLIDADALKNDIDKNAEDIMGIEDVIDYIDNASTVIINTNDIEHKAYSKGLEDGKKIAKPTGRWIDDKCSVCGKGIEDLIDSREWYRNEPPNYCPFCGVKIGAQE